MSRRACARAHGLPEAARATVSVPSEGSGDTGRQWAARPRGAGAEGEKRTAKSSSDMKGVSGEVRVEATDVAGGKASHLALVVKDEQGKETGFRGGPQFAGGHPSPSTASGELP